MSEKEKSVCPHCQQQMKKWMPPDGLSWDRVYQYVCFNDECPYYVRGWALMEEKYGRKASYRHRYNPHNGEEGPLAVWSKIAFFEGILQGD